MAQATYTAFCRNYGIYSTNAAGYHNWNEEAMETMVQHLSVLWAAFTGHVSGRSGSVVAFINEALNSACTQLSGFLISER